MRIDGNKTNLLISQDRMENRRSKMEETKADRPVKEQPVPESLSETETIKAIEKANDSLVLTHTMFEFSIHEQTREIMVKVIDEDTGEVIREIPPEKVLDMVAKMWEIAGILVDEKV